MMTAPRGSVPLVAADALTAQLHNKLLLGESVTFHAIASTAKQLEILVNICSTNPQRNDVVNRQIPQPEMLKATVTVTSLNSVECSLDVSRPSSLLVRPEWDVRPFGNAPVGQSRVL